jgi:hypothetical protein
MFRAALLFAALPLALGSTLCLAADAPVDPSITDIRSAGFWEDAGHSGTYRVVVRHFGFEEISSSITLEWVSDSTRESSAHLNHSVILADALLGAIGIDSLRAMNGGVQLVLIGPLHNGSQYHCVVVMRPDGSIGKGYGC